MGGVTWTLNFLVTITTFFSISRHVQAKPRILVYTKTAGYRHESIGIAVERITTFGNGSFSLGSDYLDDSVRPSNWDVFHTEDQGFFEIPGSLDQFDAVGFVSTTDQDPPLTGTILTNPGSSNLVNYIEKGGNFFGIHSASASLFGYPFYGRLVGAYFDYHPQIQNVGVKAVDQTGSGSAHPSVSKWPEQGFEIYEEVYNFRSDPRSLPSPANLLVTNSTSYQDPGVNPQGFRNGTNGPSPHPLAWWRQGGLLNGGNSGQPEGGARIVSSGGAGRSWYTSLGHDPETWRNNDFFLGHVFGGIDWVLKSPTTRINNSSGLIGQPPPSGAGSTSMQTSTRRDVIQSTTSSSTTSSSPSNSTGPANANSSGASKNWASTLPLLLSTFFLVTYENFFIPDRFHFGKKKKKKETGWASDAVMGVLCDEGEIVELREDEGRKAILEKTTNPLSFSPQPEIQSRETTGMGKKSKSNSAGKASVKAAKKAKAEKLADKKANKQAKKQNGPGQGGGGGKDSGKKGKSRGEEEEEEDLDALLQSYRERWEAEHQVFEEKVGGPPSRRVNATLTACPNGSDLWIFGGEYFDGEKAYFYQDLYKYSPEKDEWRSYSSQNQPGPRSAHQICASPASGGLLWCFGGEFATTKQTSFHHYRDLWVFSISTHSWDRVETKLKPSARSGHRMAMWKHYLVLFGGFVDTGARTTYLQDLWVFDTHEYKWHEIKQNDLRRPSARSGFSLLSCPEGLVLHGGYCKRYVKGQRTQGVALEDTWLLKMDEDLTKLDWVKRRKVGFAPSARSGCTMTLWGAKSMGVLFGGVTDTEADEESMESTFWNELFGYQLQGTGRWVSLNLKKPKKKGGAGKRRKKVKQQQQQRMVATRKANGKEEEEEVERRNGNRYQSDVDDEDDEEEEGEEDEEGRVERQVEREQKASEPTSPEQLQGSVEELEEEEEEEEEDDPNDPIKTIPLERYNAMLAIQRNTLYIYGGIYESERREYTLDDFYTLDLSKLDRFVCLKQCPIDTLEWNESEEEDSDTDEEGEGVEGEQDSDSSSGESGDEIPEGDEYPDEEERDPIDTRTQAEKDELRKKAQTFLGISKDSSSRSPTEILSTPLPGEILRTFYERTKQHWASQVLQNSPQLRGKEVRKLGFEMAEKRFSEYKPILEEIERIQAEAGLDEEELRNSSKASSGGALSGGVGVDSRNRR
ncbi:galactose oxidase [Violaceomyces palustris]|uniref:Galactose oxidase n=1 Tax=Violaceomyces palustris TaxID=1673888 RepID=A0ACD0NNZ7_9BASI|nr:galactose oxidase [Violaceomyces palustris]